jgi:AmiR/NasT family two-component response regulator
MEDPQTDLERATAVLVDALGIAELEAVSWLRAYACVTGRDLACVLGDVVSDRLRPSC